MIESFGVIRESQSLDVESSTQPHVAMGLPNGQLEDPQVHGTPAVGPSTDEKYTILKIRRRTDYATIDEKKSIVDISS